MCWHIASILPGEDVVIGTLDDDYTGDKSSVGHPLQLVLQPIPSYIIRYRSYEVIQRFALDGKLIVTLERIIPGIKFFPANRCEIAGKNPRHLLASVHDYPHRVARNVG